MNNYKSFESLIYTVNETSFEDIALSVFHYQASENRVYNAYLNHLQVDPGKVNSLHEIPFLPISFFKSMAVQTGSWDPVRTFVSSSTTGAIPASHLVRDLDFYLENCQKIVESFFGSLTNYHVFALLPSYLERSGSSLVAMIEYFNRKSNSALGGFYLHDHTKLLDDLDHARKSNNRKIMIWGVSFALLDLAEKYPSDWSDYLVIETGGMKGRRRELTRMGLHSLLKEGLKAKVVYSEYGMTELFSQAYSMGDNQFRCPPWMRVMIREIEDPFAYVGNNRVGGINVIDLANIHSVAFIETEDAGRSTGTDSFEVLGRLDNTDVRGCNLMIS